MQQAGTAAAGLVVNTLVGTHDLAHTGILNQGLESRQVGLVQFARVDGVQIQLVAAPLGSGMHGKMLGTGQQFAVFGIFRALQPFDYLGAHA